MTVADTNNNITPDGGNYIFREGVIPRWLCLKDAISYSRIGRDRLKELAVSGAVRGFKDPDNKRGDWIFDRLSLDEYRLSQVPDSNSDAARAILRSIS